MTNRERRLYQRRLRTTSGWTSRDLDEVLRAFGFVRREGAEHRVQAHPELPEGKIGVSRSSGALGTGCAATVARQINQLLEISQ